MIIKINKLFTLLKGGIMRQVLIEKIKEAIFSVLPITLIVFLLHFTIVPLEKWIFYNFVFGALLLIIGIGLFSLGVETSLMPMGEKMGSSLISKRSLKLIIIMGFLIGVAFTVAEPDLIVLSKQFQAIPQTTLIVVISIGVGILMVVALLRIVFKISFQYVILILYGLVLITLFFSQNIFIPIAFDSGGVTTGPIFIPLILAFGAGIASISASSGSDEDSFGILGIVTVGPFIAILILGIIMKDNVTLPIQDENVINNVLDFLNNYGRTLLESMKAIAIALLPIILFFYFYQLLFIKLNHKHLIKLGIGLIFTFFGLVLFLTGANVGFLPVGNYIGRTIAGLSYNWILIPLGFIIGFFVVMAEPAVHVLNKQVEELTNGSISRRTMLYTLAIGVAFALMLSLLRILFKINFLWIALPAYALALGLSFFTPKIFTALAFDSGSVSSGPMAATFIMPLALGVGTVLYQNDPNLLLSYAFGAVAFVTMTPIVTIQLLGVIYKIKLQKQEIKALNKALSKLKKGKSDIQTQENQHINDGGSYGK